MEARSVHRTLLVVDIEQYSRSDRNDLDRVQLRDKLRRSLDEALQAAGVSLPEQVADTGDGYLAMLGPDEKVDTLRAVLGSLRQALQRRNQSAGAASQLRLRVVVHAGDILLDGPGLVGAEVNHAFRLLDSPQLRTRLKQTTEPLVVCVSDALYTQVVRQGHAGIDPAVFERMEVRAKETAVPAWVHVGEGRHLQPASQPAGTTVAGQAGDAGGTLTWDALLAELDALPPYLSGDPSQAASPSVAPPRETQARSLPLDELAWEDFERLCLTLARSQAPVVGCRRYGRPGQRQDGVDLYARDPHDEGRFRLYQCKRVRQLPAAMVRATVEDFLNGHPFADRASVYTLCTTGDLADTAQIEAVEDARDRLASRGIRFDVWDRTDLELRLRDAPEVVERFFGLAWVASFCGRRAATRLTGQVSAPARPSRRHPAGRALHALPRVRALSEDTIRLSDTVARTAGTELNLGDGLYVERNAEAAVDAAFRQDTTFPPFIAVTGDAGVGKTSLLWRLHQQLTATSREVWMLQAGVLLRGRARGLSDRLVRTLDYDDVAEAAADAAADGGCPVLLLDTVDLLLHRTADRDDLLALITEFRHLGCPVVVSSRPQEAPALGEPAWVKLAPYEGQELDLALRRHIVRFYRDGPARDLDARVQSLLDGVASGLPIRTLCTNPLTLRMLFELYAPHEIPDEISSFGLYDEYWKARVRADRRVGDWPVDGSGRAPDLERTAAAAGMAMLAEGKPDLDHDLLAAAVADFGGDPAEIQALTGRGILQRSASGDVSFFHQTFFEHAAARGLVDRGADGLAAISGRVHHSQEDLFLLPVHEQTLLLGETAPRAVREVAEQEHRRLLDSRTVAAKASAMYVYVHRRQTTPELTQRVADSLSEDATGVAVSRFLDVAPNVADPRVPAVLQEIAHIWRRGRQVERQHALKVLRRLVRRDPEGVRQLLDGEHVVDDIAVRSGDLTLIPALLDTVMPIARDDPRWVLRTLADVWRLTIARTTHRNLHIRILEELADQADLFGAATIAGQLEAVLPAWWHDISVEPLCAAAGRVFAVEWLARGRSVESLLEELRAPAPEVLRRARLYGLARVLLDRHERAVPPLVDAFHHDRQRQGLWASIVFPPLLRGRMEVDGTPGAGGPMTIAFREWLREQLAGDPRSAGTGTHGAIPVRFLLGALRSAKLPPPLLRQLLDALPQAQEEATWRRYLLAPFLPAMVLAGHPAAAQALTAIRKEPAAIGAEARRWVLEALREAWGTAPWVEDAFLDICLGSGDASQLAKLLEGLTPPPESVKLRRAELTRIAVRLAMVRHDDQRVRGRGLQLWRILVDRGLAPAPTAGELVELLDTRYDRRMAGALLFVQRCLMTGLLPADEAMPVLERAQLPDGDGAREGLFRCQVAGWVARSKWSPAGSRKAAVQHAVTIAFTPPTNTGRISPLRDLLDHLIEVDTDLAATLVIELGRRLAAVPRSSMPREVSTRFRGALRRFLSAVPADAVGPALEAVPELEENLARRLVEAATIHRPLEDTAGHLDQLLGDQRVPLKVKETIRRIKYHRQRLQGGSSWPELYQLRSHDHPSMGA